MDASLLLRQNLERLTKARGARARIAKICGVSAGTASEWCTGTFSPGMDKLAGIALALGVTVSDLFAPLAPPVKSTDTPAPGISSKVSAPRLGKSAVDGALVFTPHARLLSPGARTQESPMPSKDDLTRALRQIGGIVINTIGSNGTHQRKAVETRKTQPKSRLRRRAVN